MIISSLHIDIRAVRILLAEDSFESRLHTSYLLPTKLIGVYLTGDISCMKLIGVHLIGVHLISV